MSRPGLSFRDEWCETSSCHKGSYYILGPITVYLYTASYVSCALIRFQAILRKLDIPFVCELYTEVASKKFEVTPSHPGMNHLEDFDAIPNDLLEPDISRSLEVPVVFIHGGRPCQ